MAIGRTSASYAGYMRLKPITSSRGLCLAAAVLAGQAPSLDTLAADCQALMSKGDPLGAIQRAQGAVQKDPTRALPHGVLAEMLMASLPRVRADLAPKFRQGARTEALKALAIDPVQPNALESLRMLDGRAVGVSRTVSGDVMLRINQAEAQLRTGQAEQAAQMFQALVDTTPACAAIDSYAGDAWVLAGKLDLAAQAYQQALRLEPECSPALRGLAATHVRSGHQDVARNLLEQAIVLDPSDRHAWDAYEAIENSRGRALVHLALPLWAVEKSPGAGELEWVAQLPDTRSDYRFWETYRIAVLVGTRFFYKKTRYPATGMIESSLSGVNIHAWVGAIKSLPSRDDTSWDPVVAFMRKCDQGNRLQAAVYLLFYDARWASEYRDWRRSNPDAATSFLRGNAVRPELH